jgi:hypothetical protein
MSLNDLPICILTKIAKYINVTQRLELMILSKKIYNAFKLSHKEYSNILNLLKKCLPTKYCYSCNKYSLLLNVNKCLVCRNKLCKTCGIVKYITGKNNILEQLSHKNTNNICSTCYNVEDGNTFECKCGIGMVTKKEECIIWLPNNKHRKDINYLCNICSLDVTICVDINNNIIKIIKN